MNILVIGNGFDLAHELPTRYSDFLNFVKSYKEQDPVYRDFINGLSQEKKKEIDNLLDNNLLLNYFLDIYHNMLCNGRGNWIDFETEISSIVQAFDNSLDEIKSKTEKSGREEIKISRAYFEKIERFNYNSMNEYQKCLCNRISIDFLEETIKMVYVDLEKVIRFLEIYLNDYVGKLDINFKLKELESIKIDHVLSFNYTNTYRKLYDPGNGCDYCFLHGKATSDSSVDTCNMVLGINEYLPKERMDSDNRFVWFKKFYQRIFKATSSAYMNWINDIEGQRGAFNADKINLYLYGHSLDVTDKDVLSKLILLEGTHTKIFYCSRKDLAGKITNLVKLIGEENLIRMTGGIDKSIVFVETKQDDRIKMNII